MAIINMISGKTPMMYRGTNTLYLSHLNELNGMQPIAQVYKAYPGNSPDEFLNIVSSPHFPVFFNTNIYFKSATIRFYNLQRLRTGPFTIEFFQKNYNTTNYGLEIRLDNIYIGRVDADRVRYFSNSNVQSITSSLDFRHIAICRKNNTDYSFFVNGDKVVDTSPTAIYDFQNSIVFGVTASINVYLAELRISNICRYTSNFTPPTAPFAPD